MSNDKPEILFKENNEISQEANESIKKNAEEVVILTRGKRCGVFIFFMLLNLIINMDNGTVPALIDQISEELELPKEIIGLFGSLQYGGNLIGNFIAINNNHYYFVRLFISFTYYKHLEQKMAINSPEFFKYFRID